MNPAAHSGKETQGPARPWVLLLAGYGIAAGVVTLLGWFLGLPRLTDWLGSGIAMFANTAAGVIASATALLLLLFRRSSDGWSVRASALLGLLVALLGGATLFEHISSTNLGIDTLLIDPQWGFRAAMAPGRMGPPASVCFTVLGLALMFAASTRRWARRIAPLLGIFVAAVCALSLLGYLFNADPLFALPKFSGIAMQTSTLLFALALGVIAIVPEHEPLRTLQQDSAAGLLARCSVPFIIGVPIVLGWMRIRAQDAGWMDRAMGTSLYTLVLIGVFSVLLWWWVRVIGRHEQASREAQERLTGLITSTMDAVIAVDAGQRVVLFNPAAEQMFGCPAREAMGASLERFIPSRFREGHRAHIATFAQTGVTSRRMGALGSLSGLRANGEEFPIEASISQMEVRGQKLFTVILRDITERKEAEDALRRSAEALEAASRAKDDFLAALSHELRTPLSPVLMLASEWEGDPTLPPELQEDISSIRRHVELEARLIDDLLDITRISRGKLEIKPVFTDVHALLQQTREILHAECREKAVEPGFHLGARAHHVMADPTRLQQVFWNLLKNAVKFTDPGGKVMVRTSNPTDDRVRISVEDTGIGISAEALQRIFRAFDQGDLKGRHRFGGLGLGLSISKALVDLHGGELRAESAGPGKGAVFTVDLAVVAAAPTPAQPVRPVALRASNGAGPSVPAR